MTKKKNFGIDSVKDLVNALMEPTIQAQVRTIVLLAAATCVAKLVKNILKHQDYGTVWNS
jgi:hypothetical protein